MPAESGSVALTQFYLQTAQPMRASGQKLISRNGRRWRKAAVRRNDRCWANNGKDMLALMFSC
jgi:hypothetical protein